MQKSGRKQGKQGAGQEGISFKLEMAQWPLSMGGGLVKLEMAQWPLCMGGGLVKLEMAQWPLRMGGGLVKLEMAQWPLCMGGGLVKLEMAQWPLRMGGELVNLEMAQWPLCMRVGLVKLEMYFPCTPSYQGVEGSTTAASLLGLSQSPFPLFLPQVLFSLCPRLGLAWKPAAGPDAGRRLRLSGPSAREVDLSR